MSVSERDAYRTSVAKAETALGRSTTDEEKAMLRKAVADYFAAPSREAH